MLIAPSGSTPSVSLPARLTGRQDHVPVVREERVTSDQEIMEILEAFDLTGRSDRPASWGTARVGQNGSASLSDISTRHSGRRRLP
jgi:hypothetical protein